MRVSVFTGRNPGSRGHSGSLAIRAEDWHDFTMMAIRGGMEVEELGRCRRCGEVERILGDICGTCGDELRTEQDATAGAAMHDADLEYGEWSASRGEARP